MMDTKNPIMKKETNKFIKDPVPKRTMKNMKDLDSKETTKLSLKSVSQMMYEKLK